MFCLSNVNAQNENNPLKISFGVNAVDIYPTGEDAPLGGYFDEFFTVSHYGNTGVLVTSKSGYISDTLFFNYSGSESDSMQVLIKLRHD